MTQTARVDILFALTGKLNHNSRAIKQLRSLLRAGYTVSVLSLDDDPDRSLVPGISAYYGMNPGKNGGYRFFYRLRKIARRLAMSIPATCYHASDLYVLSALASAAQSHGAALTYDARECYPHVASTANRPWISWYWRRYEQRLVPLATSVFTVSNSIADHMARSYGIERPAVVQNVPEGTDESIGRGELHTLTRLDAAVPIVLHLGQLRKSRGCESLIRAIGDVGAAHLVFLGYGPEQTRLESLVVSLGLKNRVHFLPPVSPALISRSIGDAAVGVTLLEADCLNHQYALPNKLFDYIHAGIPVLASDLPEIGVLVNSNNIGKTVEPGDVSAIGRALQEMISNEHDRSEWKRNANRIAETFTWASASEYFIKGMRRACTPSDPIEDLVESADTV